MNGKKGEMKLIVSFVERGQGNGLARFYTDHQVNFHYHGIGIGTASSDLLDVLGIGSAEKDVIFSIAAKDAAERLMKRLSDNLRNIREKGIVFSIPLTGLNNVVATVLERSMGSEKRTGGNEMDTTVENSLVLVMVNQGHTDEVMNTARAAGARGGTILRSRLSAPDEFSGLEHMIQEEKEIIAMVVPNGQRNVIMETVNKKHGIKTSAGAVILSLGIDQIAKLG